MLKALHSQLSPRRRADDDGAVLVTVVIVMLVGFVVATLVASSVLFTIESNVDNRGRTQAFIAAESGRDSVRKAIIDATTTAGINCAAITLSDANVPLGAPGVTYSFSIHGATGSQSSPTYAATPSCPGANDTLLVIKSTGTAPDSAPVEIESVYQIVTNVTETTGGALAYFAGSVSGQKAVYTGDLVVRTGSYDCPNQGEITGDLWVLNGTTNLGNECKIGGSIYGFGDVTSNSQGVWVGKDVISSNTVNLANRLTRVGRDIHAHTVLLSGNAGPPADAGTVVGTVRSATSITVDPGWNVPATQRQPNAGEPVFTPTLAQVRSMTKWIDFSGTAWDQTQSIVTGCPQDPTSLLRGSGRLLIDYNSCSGNDAITITIGSVEVNRDVIFIVPPTRTMKVTIDGNITSTSPIATAPQLLFIHEDRDTSTIAGEPGPTCVSTGPDDFSASKPSISAPQARLMLYTPCKLSGNVRVDYSGQFYVGNGGTGNNTSINFSNGAKINCKEMSWLPRLEKVNCYLSSAISGGTPSVTVKTLGNRVYQTEQ